MWGGEQTKPLSGFNYSNSSSIEIPSRLVCIHKFPISFPRLASSTFLGCEGVGGRRNLFVCFEIDYSKQWLLQHHRQFSSLGSSIQRKVSSWALIPFWCTILMFILEPSDWITLLRLLFLVRLVQSAFGRMEKEGKRRMSNESFMSSNLYGWCMLAQSRDLLRVCEQWRERKAIALASDFNHSIINLGSQWANDEEGWKRKHQSALGTHTIH